MKNTTLKLLNEVVYETLEDRRMMSASPAIGASFSGGVLSLTGSMTAGNRIMVNLTANGSQLQADVDGRFSYFGAKQVKQFSITTGSGSDYIYIDPGIDIPANIHSGDGNDEIRSGAGNDTIVAGNGNDIIYGKGGNNEIEAGNGNDTLMGDAGNDTLIAGNGNDSLVGGGGTDSMTAGNGNDTFLAGTSHDHIVAGTGHDVMIGGLGNTYLYGKSTGAGTSSSGSTTSGTGTKTGTGSGPSTGNPTTPTVPTVPTTPTVPITPTVPTIPVTTTGGQAPVAVINPLAGPRVTGMVVNVDALQSAVGTGTCITTNYSWDFGDAGSQFDQLTGFNAAHVYDKPGTYTISLTVTNEAGLISRTTQQVTIAASARNQIYVDSTNGSDSNRGTQNAPLQSLAAAFALLGNNTEILLRAGETFYTGASLHVSQNNVLIGRYGAGDNPQIMRTLGNGTSTINASGNTDGLTIQDITFNSPYSVGVNAIANKIGVGGIFLGGQNLAVRDCTFLNIDDAINENGNPTGVLIQGNDAPLTTGVRGYFVWGQGAQDTIIGNYAANSTREHIVRLVGVNEVNVQNNNFTNLNRQNVDTNDFSKGCIEVHRGEYDWIVGNTVADGDIRVGPLGLWGEAASSNTSYCVIEDNQLTDTFIYVQSGTHHAMIANNVIDNSAGQAIVLNGVDSQGRTSQDITIIHNTGIDTGTSGNFIELLGYVNGIVMENNLWVAPQINLASYSSAPVRVTAGNMNSFTEITGNIWPSPVTLGTYTAGGINYTGQGTLGNGYVTPAQWNALSNVGTDVFKNLNLNSSYEVSFDSMLAGAAIKVAA